MSVLILVDETVKADILMDASTTGVVVGISDRTQIRDSPPNRCDKICIVTIGGQAVLITLETILEDILTHITQVEVQQASILVVQFGVHERVKHPELDILDASLLKVSIVNFAHNATPSLLGIEQMSFNVNIGSIQVVGTALTRIEREVKRLDDGRFTIIDVTTWKHFVNRYLTGVGIGQRIQVILDVSRSIGRTAFCEQPVDGIPRQQRAILAIGDVID